jgi:hypothetical protein
MTSSPIIVCIFPFFTRDLSHVHSYISLCSTSDRYDCECVDNTIHHRAEWHRRHSHSQTYFERMMMCADWAQRVLLSKFDIRFVDNFRCTMIQSIVYIFQWNQVFDLADRWIKTIGADASSSITDFYLYHAECVQTILKKRNCGHFDCFQRRTKWISTYN